MMLKNMDYLHRFADSQHVYEHLHHLAFYIIWIRRYASNAMLNYVPVLYA